MEREERARFRKQILDGIPPPPSGALELLDAFDKDEVRRSRLKDALMFALADLPHASDCGGACRDDDCDKSHVYHEDEETGDPLELPQHDHECTCWRKEAEAAVDENGDAELCTKLRDLQDQVEGGPFGSDVDDWKEASGLLAGGDPGGVTPEMLRKNVVMMDAIAQAAQKRVELQYGCPHANHTDTGCHNCSKVSDAMKELNAALAPWRAMPEG